MIPDISALPSEDPTEPVLSESDGALILPETAASQEMEPAGEADSAFQIPAALRVILAAVLVLILAAGIFLGVKYYLEKKEAEARMERRRRRLKRLEDGGISSAQFDLLMEQRRSSYTTGVPSAAAVFAGPADGPDDRPVLRAEKEMNPMSSDTPGKLFFKNAGITALFLLLATAVAYLFFRISNNTTNVVILYLLATVLTAKETDGYLPGIAASVVSVLLINLVFTYPYMSLNFTLDGYPFTFLGMLVISAITSTLTAHLKEQNKILQKRDKLLMEAEKEKMRANLLRAVSHDLRTPLTSIIGASSSYLENTVP